MRPADIRIATAGWAIPRQVAHRFIAEGSGLQRYADRFEAVEINSTFYRPHRPATLERWAASVRRGFRFAVKAPKTITHERRLVDAADLFEIFVEQTTALGVTRGPILIQLPGTLKYDSVIAGAFLEEARRIYEGPLALEPRHASWFDPEADGLLAGLRVARVAADPAVVPQAADPGGWRGLTYWRLHGSPAMYRTPYTEAQLDALAGALVDSSVDAWCVFDNTMSGAAAANALDLLERVRLMRL